MKIAFVYDRVNKIGGAERVLTALHQVWPQAPLYTAFYNPKSARWSKEFKVIPSFANRLPFASSHHEWYASISPYAFESFNFDDFDVVITVTSAEAKGIVTKPHTLHVCYLLTPTRYLWSHPHLYRGGHYATNKNFITRAITPFAFTHLRQWDQIAATRPDQYLAISQTVAHRLKKYYRRQADAIIYPPVAPVSSNTQAVPGLPSRFFLLVSRLVPYKRLDLAIQAFNQLGLPLVVVGEGQELKSLRHQSASNIIFLGRVSDTKLAWLYRRCQALIFPSEEDFGIVSVEAQSAGKPVIGYNFAGAAETVIHGQTGILFNRQRPQALVQAVKKFQSTPFNPQACKDQAKNFSSAKFKQAIDNYIKEAWHKHQQKQSSLPAV